MIVRIVKLSLRKDAVEAFTSFFQEHRETIAAQPGCHSVKLLSDTQDETIMYTISEWDSEAALNAYRHSVFFKTIWPRAKALFRERAEAVSLMEVKNK